MLGLYGVDLYRPNNFINRQRLCINTLESMKTYSGYYIVNVIFDLLLNKSKRFRSIVEKL
jgi:hypothetical protein